MLHAAQRSGTTGARRRNAGPRTSPAASGRSRACTRSWVAAEPAVWHARRASSTASRRVGDWDLAYAYEALAQAHAVARNGAAAEWKARARAAGDEIADPEEREHFEEDYATLP